MPGPTGRKAGLPARTDARPGRFSFVPMTPGSRNSVPLTTTPCLLTMKKPVVAFGFRSCSCFSRAASCGSRKVALYGVLRKPWKASKTCVARVSMLRASSSTCATCTWPRRCRPALCAFRTAAITRAPTPRTASTATVAAKRSLRCFIWPSSSGDCAFNPFDRSGVGHGLVGADWEVHGNTGSATELSGDVETCTDGLQPLVHDGEPDTGPTRRSCGIALSAVEPLEDALLLFWADARALVGNRHGGQVVSGLSADADRRAGRRVLRRVRDEVAHDAFDRARVGPRDDLVIQCDAQVLPITERAELFDDRADG